MTSSTHGINGNLQIAVGAVFEADREGEAAGHFSVGLAFGGPCADRSPADRVGHILWGDGVKHFSCNRQTHFGDIKH